MGKNLKKLRVGVVGLGRISGRHIEPAIENGKSTLVALCDNKERVLKAACEKYGVKGYLDYKEMIDNENLDVLHICLPHYLHVPVAIYAMERGVNVLSEKPMAIKAEDGERAIKCAEKCGVNYGVIFQCRYNAPTVFVKNLLDSGKLGKIISATSVLTWYRPDEYYASSDWKGTPDKEGGGVLIDQAIHSVDLVNYFIDSTPKKISASTANHGHTNFLVEDTAEGLITYENGVRYAFYCMNNCSENEPIEIKLFCEKGKVVLDYKNACVTFSDGTVLKKRATANEFKYSGGQHYWGYAHVKQINDFYNSVLKKTKPQIDGNEALKTQKIVNAIYDSAKQNKTIIF